MADVPDVTAATLARSHRPWDGNVLVANKGWWDVAKEQYRNDGKPFPCEATRGQLRLVRTGSVLRFLVTEGEEVSFREIRQIEYTDKDISQLRFGVDTGGSPGPVEVRLIDLRVRSEELPMESAPKKGTFHVWRIILSLGVGGLSLVLVTGLLWWKKMARAKKAT